MNLRLLVCLYTKSENFLKREKKLFKKNNQLTGWNLQHPGGCHID